MVARSPGLPRHPIFRSQPGLARRLEAYGELSASTPQASARQLRVAVEVSFLLTRRALLREPPAFSAALVFPVLRAPGSLSQLFLIFVRFLSREISFSRFSVWVWVCGAVLISVRRPPQASCAAWPMGLPPLSRQILSRTLPCHCAAIPVGLTIRWHREPISLSPAFPGSGSAIFLAWEKGPLPFATRRWLILPLEWRRTPRLAWQRLDVSSLIYSLLFLLRESEIFSVWEMRRLSRLTPIRRDDFFVLH